MAGKARRTNADLVAATQAVAPDASLFELLRVLEALAPGATPIGTSGPVGGENLRMRGHLTMGFPTRDVAEVGTTGGSEDRLQLDVAFLTLYGADSPLPQADTIRLLRAEHDDTRARDFLDVFNHRLLSVLYRAWARSRPYTAGKGSLGTPAGRMLASLVDPMGRGAEAWSGANLRFGGRRSAQGLRRRLSALLPGRGVRIETCVPQRVPLPDDQRCRLGLGASTLGGDCMIGSHTWDATGRFRVHLGPLDRDDFERLTPGSPLHREITELVDSWGTTQLSWRLRVTLRGDAASPARLASEGSGRRLGVDTWLGKPGDRIQTTDLDPYRSEGVRA